MRCQLSLDDVGNRGRSSRRAKVGYRVATGAIDNPSPCAAGAIEHGSNSDRGACGHAFAAGRHAAGNPSPFQETNRRPRRAGGGAGRRAS